MNNRSYCNRTQPEPATRLLANGVFIATLLVVLGSGPLARADAPAWMHSVVSAPLPEHDEKTDAVLLYAEENVTVVSAEKIKTQVRRAYKILRPGGREYGVAVVYFRIPGEKVTGLRGWCIPAQGKDYEVKDKEALEVSPQGMELVGDLKAKVLRIPAPDPANIVGYEYEVEERPLVLQDEWEFQGRVPVRESHFSLQLPPGWEYKASWLNYPEVKPSGNGQQWTVSDIKAIRHEPNMPPFRGVAGRMILSFIPPGGITAQNGFSNWQQMGAWSWNLTQGRTDASPQIKEKVATLTASKSTSLQKMQALAQYVQQEVRYVAIELGIGGWQPHPAAETFAHSYGDCKDKATLLRSMLREIGIDSFPVAINVERGAVTVETPAHQGFDHEIVAIKLPQDVQDPSLIAILDHPKFGRLLFFDPTSEMTPFGQISGPLQSNYGLLIAPDGGELLQLPRQSSATNSITRKGMLSLDPTGKLKGEVEEIRLGGRASEERWRLRAVTKDSEKIKPIEDLLSGSLSLYQITQASVLNMTKTDQPFGFHYSFEAPNYAKQTGGLLLVRPRVLGVKSEGFLETKDPRKFPVEFEGPAKDTDTFDITIPTGYVVDDVPPAIDADYDFASYHAKTEVKGNLIHYSRTYEIKELSVPVARADDLKKFYRIIASDERNTVVLKADSK